MKLKNILLSGLSLVLVAALAIGGTVAYLQDEDSDVNVMTLGNVKIEQHEYERVTNADGSYKTDTIDNVTSYVLQDFTQGKPLLPSAVVVSSTNWDSTIVRMTQVGSYGSMNTFLPITNAQDKFVTVENTGKTDAYVRTLVAIEIGDASESLIGSSYHQTWTENEVGTISVDGNNYYVTEYVYAGGQLSDGTWRHQNGILPAGDTSYPSLSQVYIKPEATNEDMVALDGNGNGTLDILVLSQAVQAAGFADAETALNAGFGDITTTNHPWSTEAPVIPNTVTSVAEMTAAMDADEDVLLAKDFVIENADAMSSYYGLSTGGSIDGNGKTITDNSGVQYAGLYAGGEINKDFTLNTNSLFGIYSNANNNAIKLENVTINKTSNSSAFYTQNSPYGVVLENCTMNASGIGANAGAADGVVFATGVGGKTSLVTINSGTYTATGTNGNVVSCFYSTATVTINGGTFTGNLYAVDDGNIVINGGTFNGGFNVLGGNIVINGGTFDTDPSAYVAAGKTATDNGNGTWTVA